MGKIFQQSYVDKTHVFFEKYGNRALILARFVPIVRTFVTLVAGVGKMDFRKFITYTAIGGVLWACGITILGYYLGRIPVIQHNLEAALILIVFVSVIPMLLEYVLHKRRAKSGTRCRRGGADEPRSRGLRSSFSRPAGRPAPPGSAAGTAARCPGSCRRRGRLRRWCPTSTTTTIMVSPLAWMPGMSKVRCDSIRYASCPSTVSASRRTSVRLISWSL